MQRGRCVKEQNTFEQGGCRWQVIPMIAFVYMWCIFRPDAAQCGERRARRSHYASAAE